jgi:elongation factor P--(R)-beta-lysine ligase
MKNLPWHPTATLQTLITRATIIDKIRDFFKSRDVLEVETPLLANSTASDPYIQSFSTHLSKPHDNHQKTLYLQTSPEFAMKRLLAAGIGSIYQICKAFRKEESGRLHNPEFTILEWYRLGFDHHQLMEEMDLFLNYVIGTQKAKKLSYQTLFLKYLGLDPHQASTTELQQYAIDHHLPIENKNFDKDTWLQLLMNHFIEPFLGHDEPVFIYDFPASQAALSKIRHEPIPIAERFEVYIAGLEIANGYHELANPEEQQSRFEQDLIKRSAIQEAPVPLDHHLIAALMHGLPSCAGVALGIDRLIMLATKKTHIADVIAFPTERA